MFKINIISVCLKLFILLSIIFSLNIIPSLSFALENYSEQKKVWVIFADKGISSRYNNLDLPVYQPYIDEITDLGASLCIKSRWLNAITITAEDDVIKKISRLSFVKAIEPVISYRTKLPKREKRSSVLLAPSESNSPYGVSATQIEQAKINTLHDRGFFGEGVTIALLDTGFNLSHTSLKDVKVIAQYDFINRDEITSNQPPDDDIGQDNHGTEVLSIIAGNDPGRFIGVAHKANYLLAKTEKVSEDGIMFERQIEEDWWVAGIEWAEQNGADIVSSSLGYSDWYSYSDMNGRTAKTTIAANIAIEKGMVVVVSAGNDGKSSELPYISAPADGFNVVAVGAVDEFGDLADFSSIGPTYDGRIKPDLVAMGSGTYVADPSNNQAYRKANGTSMSAPIVAGTIALLKQALPEISSGNILVKLLKYTASRSLNPDNRYGWGLINAESAYRYIKFPGAIMELDNWDPNGSSSDYKGTNIYPNPISRNSSKSILNIHSNKPIRGIKIYDMVGLLIYQRLNLYDARFLTWNLRNAYDQEIASGVYICFIQYNDESYEIKKIAVIK